LQEHVVPALILLRVDEAMHPAGDPEQVYRDRVHWSRWHIHFLFFDMRIDPSVFPLTFAIRRIRSALLVGALQKR
jgi:hypothetical protein